MTIAPFPAFVTVLCYSDPTDQQAGPALPRLCRCRPGSAHEVPAPCHPDEAQSPATPVTPATRCSHARASRAAREQKAPERPLPVTGTRAPGPQSSGPDLGTSGRQRTRVPVRLRPLHVPVEPVATAAQDTAEKTPATSGPHRSLP